MGDCGQGSKQGEGGEVKGKAVPVRLGFIMTDVQPFKDTLVLLRMLLRDE